MNKNRRAKVKRWKKRRRKEQQRLVERVADKLAGITRRGPWRILRENGNWTTGTGIPSCTIRRCAFGRHALRKGDN